jgi:AcrR family transcriptional regulator
MPRTPEQYKEIREGRKEQIMKSALLLFAKEGYGHVSIASLARHAGISKGLMYNYFDSKEELLKSVIDYSMTEILSYFDPNKDGILTTEEFELFIRNTFRLMREEREFYTMFFGLIVQPNVIEHFNSGSINSFFQQYFIMFETYFREQGFEDPLLEVLNLSILIEGMGMMMVFYDGLTELLPDHFDKFEERIISTYTNNHD